MFDLDIKVKSYLACSDKKICDMVRWYGIIETMSAYTTDTNLKKGLWWQFLLKGEVMRSVTSYVM